MRREGRAPRPQRAMKPAENKSSEARRSSKRWLNCRAGFEAHLRAALARTPAGACYARRRPSAGTARRVTPAHEEKTGGICISRPPLFFRPPARLFLAPKGALFFLSSRMPEVR